MNKKQAPELRTAFIYLSSVVLAMSVLTGFFVSVSEPNCCSFSSYVSTGERIPVLDKFSTATEHFERFEPVVFRGNHPATAWSCMAKWTPEYLVELSADSVVSVKTSPTTSFQYVDTSLPMRSVLGNGDANDSSPESFNQLHWKAHTQAAQMTLKDYWSQASTYQPPFRAPILSSRWYSQVLQRVTGVFCSSSHSRDETGFTEPFRHLYFAHELEEDSPFLRDVGDVLAFVPRHQELETIKVWMGNGVVSQTHFDASANFNIQVHGRKRFILSPPQAHSKLHLFPHIHPQSRKSQVDFKHPNKPRLPYFRNVPAFEVILEEGDVLYIPPFWFHRVETVEPAINLNIWSSSWEVGLQHKLERVPLPLEESWTLSQKALALKVLYLKMSQELCKCLPTSSLCGQNISLPLFLLRSRYAPLLSGPSADQAAVAYDSLPSYKLLHSTCLLEREVDRSFYHQTVLKHPSLTARVQECFDVLSSLVTDARRQSLVELFLLNHIEVVTEYMLGTDNVLLFLLACFPQ